MEKMNIDFQHIENQEKHENLGPILHLSAKMGAPASIAIEKHSERLVLPSHMGM